MSDTESMMPKNTGNDIFQNISNLFKYVYDQLTNLLQQKYQVHVFMLVMGVIFIFLGPCLIGSRISFTNELEQVNEEPKEPCHDGTDSSLINTPICSEKTYENTTLENTSPSEFEVLKNFDILETNNIVSVKEKINDYSNQPTFPPGKFN